jgi:hypothetical protein
MIYANLTLPRRKPELADVRRLAAHGRENLYLARLSRVFPAGTGAMAGTRTCTLRAALAACFDQLEKYSFELPDIVCAA